MMEIQYYSVIQLSKFVYENLYVTTVVNFDRCFIKCFITFNFGLSIIIDNKLFGTVLNCLWTFILFVFFFIENCCVTAVLHNLTVLFINEKYFGFLFNIGMYCNGVNVVKQLLNNLLFN